MIVVSINSGSMIMILEDWLVYTWGIVDKEIME
jgi:hypothetical protein